MLVRLFSWSIAVSLVLLLSACGSSKPFVPPGSPVAPGPLTVVTSSLPAVVVNQPYNAALTASGGISPYAWSLTSGALPPGVTLSRSGTLSGIPTSIGGFSFTATIADSEQPPSLASSNLTISVQPVLAVATSSLSNGTPGVAYTAALTATGGIAPYHWSVTQGNLPNGLVLDATSGTIAGTPTSVATFPFTVTVSDSQQSPSTASASLSIAVGPALSITTTSLSNGSPGVFYSGTLSAAGGLAPYNSWTITQGSLPSGLMLDTTSGVISGTPTLLGASTFTVQVSDSESPTDNASAQLSIAVNPPPARGAALYIPAGEGRGVTYPVGLDIASDGSLSLLPSSPELAINGQQITASPTFPLLFLAESVQGHLETLLVNPDYSVTLYQSSTVPGANFLAGTPSVDPTGSDLYVPVVTNLNGLVGTLELTIFTANGSLQEIGSVSVTTEFHSDGFSGMIFTPDGKLAFVAICNGSADGQIFSFTSGSNGNLSPAGVTSLSRCAGTGGFAVSPDGKYLATSEVQVYSIAGDGTLTPVLGQPFIAGPVTELTWDSSGSYLLAGTNSNGTGGGLAVLQFSGSTLTETVQLSAPLGVNHIVRTGSFLYATPGCESPLLCQGLSGYDFQNGQLTPLPGSPYPYGTGGGLLVY